MLKGNDVPTVMARVETALSRALRSRDPRAPSVVVVHDVVADELGIAALRHPAAIQIEFPSGSARPVIGRAITVGKRFLRRGVRWYSGPIAEQQTRFNHATLDLAERLHRDNERLAAEIGQLRVELAGAVRMVERLEADVQHGPDAVPGAPGDSSRLRPSVQLALDYRGFEDRHRGDVDEVTELLRPYVRHFRGCRRVVDIGCGRGEFLQLLTAAGIDAYGVDLDEGMVAACTEKGLDAEVVDGLDHLRSLESGAVDGVFCSQVAEHLTTGELVTLLELSYRKLADGGRILLETPNPESLSIFASFFYVDLTHVRPVHPEAMVWALESAGFVDVQVERVQPVPPMDRLQPLPHDLVGREGWRTVAANTARLDTLLFGPQHYAAYGRKDAGVR